jgi:NAD/NADP transhydrogenase alpha subunit
VAATPAPVLQPLKLGYAVVVEPGAGEALNFGDQAYIDAGARVGSAVGADVVLAVNATDPRTAGLDDPRGSIEPYRWDAVLTVWNADDVVIFKRSLTSGYAGV